MSLTVPAGWTVMATGTLENPEEVWSEQTRRRLSAAAVADTVVHVASGADRQANRVTLASSGGLLTYRSPRTLRGTSPGQRPTSNYGTPPAQVSPTDARIGR